MEDILIDAIADAVSTVADTMVDHYIENKLHKPEFKVGQVIEMKKPHPCGANSWKILRVGMDFRISCTKCGRSIMVPRKTVEKGFKRFIEENE